MIRFKGLAAALAVALLVVPSAFADFRHSKETHGRDSGGRSFERHDRGGEHRTWDRGNANNTNRDRSFRDNNNYRDNNYRDHSYRDNSYRGGDRSYRDNSYRNENHGSRGSFDRGRPFFHEGRVSRYERWNGGYRVWIGGAPYPFFIPEARFRLFPRFHVGLSIRLGGYYNPLGYYDYYDGPYYDGYYSGYGSPAYVAGELRGIVESVDYRRGTVLVRDTASDRIVNVVMRGDDPRFGDLRIGDYVELSGDWTRIGTFDAYRVYDHDTAGYRYYER